MASVDSPLLLLLLLSLCLCRLAPPHRPNLIDCLRCSWTPTPSTPRSMVSQSVTPRRARSTTARWVCTGSRQDSAVAAVMVTVREGLLPGAWQQGVCHYIA